MQTNTLTIRQARLQGRDGLWQLTIENGRFSRIESRKPHLYRKVRYWTPKVDSLSRHSSSRISIWTPRKRQASQTGISRVRCLKVLSAGLNVKRC